MVGHARLLDAMFEDDLDKRKWMRSQPSYGPDWDAAIEFGNDISVIEHSLSLSFDERFEESLAMTKLAYALDAAFRGPVTQRADELLRVLTDAGVDGRKTRRWNRAARLQRTQYVLPQV